MTFYETFSLPRAGSKTVVQSDPNRPAGSYWQENAPNAPRVPPPQPAPARQRPTPPRDRAPHK
jgi:hypothetical protein